MLGRANRLLNAQACSSFLRERLGRGSPQVFFDIEIGGQPAGRITIGLYGGELGLLHRRSKCAMDMWVGCECPAA